MALDPTKPISNQERVFLTKYALTGNMLNSLRSAGYSQVTQRQDGYKILRRPHVQKAYQEIIARPLDEIQASLVRIVRENSYVAFSDLGECFDREGNVLPIEEMPESARRAVSSMKVTRKYNRNKDGESELEVTREIKLWSKPQALEMFFKYHDMIRQVMDEEVGISSNNRKEFTVEKLLAEGIKQGLLPSGKKMGNGGNGGNGKKTDGNESGEYGSAAELPVD